MRVAIIGARGQLGTDLVKVMADWSVIPLAHEDVDVCDAKAARQVLERVEPDVVVNTAAYNRVDECEEEVEKAFAVNAFAVRNVAEVCADLGALLVHISTNYVFDGLKREPYSEGDLPNPVNVYGLSKLAGEYFARNYCKRHLVIRTSGLYGVAGSRAKGGNFVEAMIRLAAEGKIIRVVDDQFITPTYTRDLALKIRELIEDRMCGLYHVTNSGYCSWHSFAERIFSLVGLNVQLLPISSADLRAKARRPGWSVLGSEALRRAGLGELRSWDEALVEYLQERSGQRNE